MGKLVFFLTCFAALTLSLVWAGAPARADGIKAEQIEFFEKKIRPILVQHCYGCHSTKAKKLKGELRLDSRAAALKGGESGPALVAGHPEKSRLIEALRYKDVDLQMPPAGKLPDAIIAEVATWIAMGAPWPTETGGAETTAPAKAVFDLHKRKRDHWSWQPLRSPGVPAVKDRTWPGTPADRFLLAGLEEMGIRPAPRADRRTLIRRVYFDLIGIPPALADLDAFVNDRSVDAFAKVVDRLQASPHFGERWGRHWLDLVRYAESRGHEFDYNTPNAFQYRDYVIRAINADVPYDVFVTEHLAGDLMPRPRLHPREGYNESILGTGFWFLGEELHSPVDICQDQADRFDNKIDVMGKAFLGLTIACARCHDHKFDAISTKDYYALFGFLKGSTYRLAAFDSLEQNRRIESDLRKLDRTARPLIQHALARSFKPGIDRVADYLLAASEVMLTKASDARRHRAEVARTKGLNGPTLERWVEYLKKANKDPGDPFHPWATLAVEPAATDAKRWADLVQRIDAAWKKQDADASSALKDAEMIVDYGHLKPDQWIVDGPSFGLAPVAPGEARFGDDPARPIVKIYDCAAAEKDPTWNNLKPAAGAENDPGALGAAVRSGRTLFTPTFKVTTGKVFYLVKGTGLAYASVDSHTMIAGPLHAHLVQPIPARPGFHWVGHDLTRYKGLDAHLEFTATSSSDFAVALVVQSERPPARIDRPNTLLMILFGSAEARSPSGLARGYQRVLVDVASRMGDDRIMGGEDAAAYAGLASWLIQRPDLLGADTPDASRQVTAAARPLLGARSRLRARIKNESRLALAMLDVSGVDEHVYVRGSHKALGEKVGRRFLEALAGTNALPVARGSGRLELARQMTDPALNPFLARVMVNRLWHHLFGRGIVGSVDNFGVLGETPTHPRLLDHLASRFIEQRWSIKKMVRAMVLSSAYRMSSRTAPHADDEQARFTRAEQVDPQNLLLHHMRIRRLEGEAIRDSLLTISGQLDARMFGPAVPVYLTPFLEGRGRPASGPLDGDGRRSVYGAVRRNFLPPLMLAFDTPIPFSTVGKRTSSNVPAQALILMNDPFVHQQARRWAEKIVLGSAPAPERVIEMYRSAFSRPPTEQELAVCLAFLQHRSGRSAGPSAKSSGAPKAPEPSGADVAAWADLAHVLINTKEFIFLR
jgi:mono/diheme cytochrome c family protein